MKDQSDNSPSTVSEPRVTVVIPAPLRSFTAGQGEIEVAAISVAKAIDVIGQRYDGLSTRILTPEGAVRPLVNIFIDKDDIRSLDGLDTILTDGAVMAIIPAIAGG